MAQPARIPKWHKDLIAAEVFGDEEKVAKIKAKRDKDVERAMKRERQRQRTQELNLARNAIDAAIDLYGKDSKRAQEAKEYYDKLTGA